MANPYVRNVATYESTEVTTANRLKLLIMLYDAAVRFMKQAKEHLLQNDIANKGLYISKALAIFSEFRGTLDFWPNPELAGNLDRLYSFINERLVTANIKNDTAMLDQALRITNILREGWVALSQQAPADAPGLDVAARQINENSCLRISV